MKKLIVLSLFIFSFKATSQSYLISSSNDSIVGTFRVMEDSQKNEFIRINTSNGKESYSIIKVKKAVDKKGKVYVPLLIDGKYRFGQEVVTGYLSKYLYTPIDASHQFQNEVFVKLDGSTLVVPGTFGFKNLVSEYLEECPRVSNAVINKQYKQYETTKLVNDFNACMTEIGYTKRTSAADVRASLTTSKLDEATTKKISDFKTLLNYSTEVSDKDEALEMFDDIVEKLSKGESIPNYLRNAFRKSISGDKKLIDLYKEIDKEEKEKERN